MRSRDPFLRDDSFLYAVAADANDYAERMAKDNRKSKRGYSRDFRPHGDTGKRYLLDDIPAGLWADVRAKAKREGVSVRALILSLLKEWVERGKA